MPKYKACCGNRCCNFTCEIRDNGGCYCACRSADHIKTAKDIIAGRLFKKGSVRADNNGLYFALLSKEEQEQELAYRKEIALELPKLEKMFKEKFLVVDESND